MDDAVRSGRCLCGGVRFKVTGPLGEALNCYCSLCRRAHSGAFRTRVAVGAEQVQVIAGEDLIASYETSPGQDRQFCKVCGSWLATVPAGGSKVGLSLALLDDADDVVVTRHVFVADRAGWVTICGDAPQYSGMPE